MDYTSVQTELHRYYDQLASGICFVSKGKDRQVLFVNQGLLEMYHCKDEAAFDHLTGRSFRGMTEGDIDSLAKLQPQKEGQYISFLFRTADGKFQRARGIVRSALFADTEPAWLIQLTGSEMTSALNGIDDLTGTLSMHRFFERASQVARLEGPQGKLSEYCPTYFNVTNFRLYNAIHGLPAGDRCLKRIAVLLQQQFPMALVTRLSADSFAVLAPREGLFPKIELICSKIDSYTKNPNILLKAGVCLLQNSDTDIIHDTFDRAKVACDTIKGDANHCWALYSRDMSENLEKKAFVLGHFDKALEKGYIKVYYQPVIRAMTEKICGVEALARWEDPLYGLISPGTFVPVLEKARLIDRLDRYIIRQVASQLYRRINRQEAVVPVSLNLSRYDFNLMDPFAFIEEVVHQYDLPREYIRIEVTESALVTEKQELIQALGRFRDAGYRVWLDDFGSAYSSLNVLHNYHFDELKIDMAFLRNFNEQSRQIITAIVLMSKTLGIHALAEGAETKEQVEFLKRIGCEKIQGYYFAKPMCYDDFTVFCQAYAQGMETRLEEHVYDKAGQINVVTDAPVGIFRYDGKKLTFLLKNEIYDEVLRSQRTWDRSEAGYESKIPDISVQPRFKTFLDKAVTTRREEATTYIVNGQYLRLFAEIIGGTAGFYVGRTRIYNITYDQDLHNMQRVDALLRNILLIYDGLYSLNSQADTVEIIKTRRPDVSEGDQLHGIRRLLKEYANRFIHDDDRERFLTFMDMEELQRRIQDSKRPETGSVFRVKQDDGSYRWMVFIAIILEGRERHAYNVLLCTREAVWEEEEKRAELLPLFVDSFGLQLIGAPSSGYQRLLQDFCQSMIRHSGIKFFWKDRQRRFIGVSQDFLDYYSIPKAADIIGKTDEDMGWHINYRHFQDEERLVLEKGRISHHAIGQCIVRGRPHRIMATKFPIYRGQKIIGLIGYFYDLDKLDSQKRQLEELSIIDPETQLLNFRGLLLVAIQYIDNYRVFGDDYTCVLLDVPEIDRIRREYGPDIAGELLQRVTEEVVRINPLKETIAHLGHCRFLFLKSGDEDEHFQEAMQALAKAIHGITSVQGYRCTLYLRYAVAKGSEGQGFEAIMQLLSARLANAQQNGQGLNDSKAQQE